MKLFIGILLTALIIGGIVLVVKLIGGAFSLLGGFLNLILGLAVIAALIIIVVWMLNYAKKNR